MLYVICGPTASGKTEIAIALANKKGAPIINADAFQVYREMNIGTAKIDNGSEEYKKHYLIDIIDPSHSFNVKDYQTLFRNTIKSLSEKCDDIVIVGGTGLYIKAALYDYVFEEQEDINYPDLEEMSNDELYKLLQSLDFDASVSIHPNNRKRVIRAITIARTGSKKSDMINAQEHKMIYPESDVKILFINPNREMLYQNINDRVDTMFKNDALIKEVKMLLEKYDLSLTAKQAIGYKETIDFINGKMSLDECKELIKKRTRNYAKRQVTFFKNQFNCSVFSSKSELLEEILNDRI